MPPLPGTRTSGGNRSDSEIMNPHTFKLRSVYHPCKMLWYEVNRNWSTQATQVPWFLPLALSWFLDYHWVLLPILAFCTASWARFSFSSSQFSCISPCTEWSIPWSYLDCTSDAEAIRGEILKCIWTQIRQKTLFFFFVASYIYSLSPQMKIIFHF